MKAIPKHFKLAAEHPNSYEIHDTRDKKNFHVAKSALNLDMHAKLAKIPRFEDGGTVSRDPASAGSVDLGKSSDPTINIFNGAQPEPNSTGLSGQPEFHAAGATPAPPASTIDPRFIGSPPTSGGVVPSARIAASEAPPEAPRAPATPQVASPAAPPQVPPVPQAPGLAAQGQSAEGMAEKGIRGMNNAAAEQSKNDAAAIAANNERMAQVVAAYKQSRANLDQENATLTKGVMDQTIDPNRWFHDKSIPSKISTAIGIAISGIGAGLQHSNTNQALQAIQEQIRNDIEAQKADLGKKQSLLSMNLEKYRNLDAATAATMAQMNAMVEGQMKLNAAKNGSAKAQANTLYSIGELRKAWLREAPALAMADMKAKQLAQLNAEDASDSAASQVIGKGKANPGTGGPTTMDSYREAANMSGGNAPAPAQGTTPQVTGAPQPSNSHGYGINLNRLAALKVTGALDKDEAKEASTEAGKYTKLQHELQEADSVFDIAAKNATLRGRISRGFDMPDVGSEGIGGVLKGLGSGAKRLAAFGDEPTKQYRAVVDPFVDKLAKDVTGRSTPISIEKLGAVIPEQGDDPDTLAIKRAKLHDLLKSSYTFPTLQEHKLIHKNDPLIRLDSEG